jgi:hypothetical protein
MHQENPPKERATDKENQWGKSGCEAEDLHGKRLAGTPD